MENENNKTVVSCNCDTMTKNETSERTVEPVADIYETADSFVVKLDMPGSSKEGISLNMEPNRMEIRGSVPLQTQESNKIVFAEIGRKIYYREFNLGKGVDIDAAAANYEDGVLTVTLPKSEAVKPRTININ
jgi:HSP20 family molecular chaperone IbpA